MLFLQSYIKFDTPRKSGFKEVVSLANSLESEVEEDEKKEMEYSRMPGHIREFNRLEPHWSHDLIFKIWRNNKTEANFRVFCL